ncbi:MAG: murein biosynthesis integral membrane protein MurJ [Anaerolineales bacterium]|nr:murein biosynthesis integral membrane protein MurJ [Anaerolineales bacterium]
MSTQISTPKPPSANQQIARAAGLVTLAFIISNLTGLLRQVLLAGTFGTSDAVEAFNAANRVSETLFNLVAGGALGSAFIPTFAGLLTEKKRQKAWELASAVANLTLIILTLAAGLAAIFAPQVVRHILAPGFSADPAKEALTISLTRIMLPSAVLFGLSGLVMGILNSKQVFFIPALTPSMYQLGLIFGILVLAPRMGIYGLAWGVLIGSALHLLLQLPALIRQKGHYKLSLGFDSPHVREVVRLMGPRLVGVAVVQLNFWINVRLASQQPQGSVAAIQYAFTLMLMPQAAIAQSIATAALPTFSAQVVQKRFSEMRDSLSSTLRGVLLLAIPASTGLVLLRKPIISLLYEGGEFTAYSTTLVAWALLWYGIGLVGHSMVEILARAFYALHDTRTPVLIGSAAMTLNVVFSYAFSALFRSLGWLPHGGLALANSLATYLEMVGLLYLMRNRLGGLKGKKLLGGALQAVFASGLMAAGIILWTHFLGGARVWLTTGGGVLLGGFIYLAVILILGVKEGKLALNAAKRKLQELSA